MSEIAEQFARERGIPVSRLSKPLCRVALEIYARFENGEEPIPLSRSGASTLIDEFYGAGVYETYEERFGGCPKCSQTDGPINIGAERWLVCHEHNMKWLIEPIIYWTPEELTALKEATSPEDEALLETYVEVKPRKVTA